MLIDFHVHIGLPEHRTCKGSELADLHLAYPDLIKAMDKSGVSQAVVCPIPHRDYDIQESNKYLLEAVTESNDRLIPFCRIDKHLEQNLQNGFKGAKLHMGRSKGADLSYENIKIKNIVQQLRVLEDYGAPLFFHASFKNKPKQIKEILEVAPNLFLILAHCGRGNILTTEQVLENVEALKKYDRVYFETSTLEDPLTGKGEILQQICNIVGAKRILFGTDFPFLRDHCTYKNHIDYLIGSQLDKLCIRTISYDNAVRLLNLNNDSNRITIRRTNMKDIPHVFDKFFEELPTQDKKYLSLSSKLKYREHWEKHISAGKSCFVVQSQQTIVGYMRCFENLKDKSEGDLWDFVVHPNYRSRGIAKQMLQYLHRRFLKIFTKTDAKNNPMIGLLNSFGYASDNLTAPRVIKWHRK